MTDNRSAATDDPARSVRSVRSVFAFYLAAAWRYPGLLLGGIAGVPLVVAASNLLPALIVSHVLNRLARHDYTPHAPWKSFSASLIAYALVTLAPGVFAWRIVDICAFRLEANVSQDLAQQTYKHLLEESSDFHADTFGGSLVSQTTKLLGGYVRIFDTFWFQVLPLAFTLVGVVAIMAPRSLTYAVVLTVFSAVFLVVAFLTSAPTRRAGASHSAAESAQTGTLADSITNILAIKSFAREEHEHRRFATATARTRESLLELMRTAQRQQVAFGFVTSGISALSLTVGVIAVVSLDASIGLVFLMVSYTTTMAGELYQFSNNSLRTLNRAVGDAGDMVATLHQTPSVLDPAKPEPSRIARGDIVFDRVTFTHGGANDALFHELSLHIRPGERVGLVGHSGSGKTTFTRLLLRVSDLDAGRILIDGQDIARITQRDLHAAIAYVPQEPLLFHRSITDNVAYGRLEATGEEIAQAARHANAMDFIQTLTTGFDTLVGERGVKLSGGQRQRIAIARAMVKDAPILILDEATSALDSTSEALIQDALQTLMQGRTTLVIAHRLSTIARLDRIVVLDEGRVIEQGTHAELLDAGGAYASYWARQSDTFIEA